MSFDVTSHALGQEGAQLLADLKRRHGEPARLEAFERGTDAWRWWEDGSLLLLQRALGAHWLTWREGKHYRSRAWAKHPTAERWLELAEHRHPRFAIGEEGELLRFEPSRLAAVGRAFPGPSAAYFFERVDLASIHQAASRETVERRACQLCQEAVRGAYVERVHRQASGDNRRAHLACAQRAVDVALRHEPGGVAW